MVKMLRIELSGKELSVETPANPGDPGKGP